MGVMTVQFFNKNYTSGSATLTVKPGAIITESKNELLDNATILLSQVTSPLLIEPFDIAVITETNFAARRFAIDTITERQVSLDPVIYEYQITLFSETKILENYPLPNLSITQPSNPADRKSIYFYMAKYLEMYGPKRRVRQAPPNTTLWLWQGQFSLTANVISVYGAIECPEFQWNNPTLREVLTDLMMVADRIPILRNNDIDALDLTEKGSAISLSPTNFVERVMTSADAVSELRLNMENAITAKRDNLDTVTRKVEFTSFRNANSGAYVDTDNMEIVVDNPIYKLLRVTMMLPMAVSNYWSDFNWVEIDITNHCVEKGIYDLLTPEPKSLTPYIKNVADINRKQFNVFYQRGGRTITGWGLKYNIGNFLFLTFNEYPFDSILQYVLTTQTLASGFNRMDTVFRVEYETLGSVVMDVGRNYDIKFNQRTTFDNQSNAYVDVNAQGKLTQFKVNRLGNDVAMVYGRYDNTAQVPVLGSTYNNDYIIFSREISFFQDYILVKMQAMKNYILRDYFTGVQSRKRNTELATESSFIRHDLRKLYAEFSFVPKFERQQYSYLYNFSAQIMKSLFAFASTDSVSSPLVTAAIKTSDPVSGAFPSNSAHYYAIEIDKKVSGNSLLVTIGAKDNISVGDQIILRTITGVGSNLRTQERYNYANAITGEFNGIRIMLVDNYSLGDGFANWPSMGDYYTNAASNVSGFLTEMRTRPLLTNLNTSLSPLRIELPIYKDNKEIFKSTLQVEFSADSRNIVFTDQLLKLQKFVREKDFYETRTFITVGKSAFPYISNQIGMSPAISYTLSSYMNPSNYLGYSVPWARGGIVTPVPEEYVAVLNASNVPVWQDFPPILNLPQTSGGSSYAPIHKVGNKYGTWVGQVNLSFANQLMPFWVPFDGTGAWTNANDHYIQIVTSTILNPLGAGGLTLANFTASNHKGGAAVVLNGSTYEVWFSLPVATFQASSPFAYTGQSWQWVRKDVVITNLLNVERIYVNYTDNNIRYRWSGTTFTTTSRVLPVRWKVFVGTTSAHVYNEYDTLPKGSVDNNRDITITDISASTIRILFTGSTSGITSIGLVDEDNKLILGVNGTNPIVYLNLLQSRDTRVFSSRASNNIVGSINNTTNSTFAV
jgi:hypothetical protein